MSVRYRMRRWYDHWLVLVYLSGSVFPRAMLSIVFSTCLCILYWVVLGVRGTGEPTALGNPQVYGYFMQCAALVLAFTTSISYSRFWEALGHLTQMTNAMSQAASFVLSFDECTDAHNLKDENRAGAMRWRAVTLHYFSIFHAVCCQTLFSCDGVDAKLDIIGGLTEEEKLELGAVRDQASLVAHWINERIARRVMDGGLRIPPPICSHLWQQLSAAMTNFQSAVKILDTPLPLPYQQCLAWSDIIVMCLTPFIICSYVQSLTLATLFTFCTAWLFHGIYLADVTMQQPFGNKDNDLPVVERHRDFIDRLISYITLELAHEINKLYEHVDSHCSMQLSNHGTGGSGHHTIARPVSFRAIEVIPRRHSEDCGKMSRGTRICDDAAAAAGPLHRTESVNKSTPIPEHPLPLRLMDQQSSPISGRPIATDPPLFRSTPLDFGDRAASARPLKARCSAPESSGRGSGGDNGEYDPTVNKQVITYRCAIRSNGTCNRDSLMNGNNTNPSPMTTTQKPLSRIISKQASVSNTGEGPLGLFLGDKILAKEYLMPASRGPQSVQPVPQQLQQQQTVHHHHNYHINHHHHHLAGASPRPWLFPFESNLGGSYLPILSGLRDNTSLTSSNMRPPSNAPQSNGSATETPGTNTAFVAAPPALV